MWGLVLVLVLVLVIIFESATCLPFPVYHA
jgi:hypothetical protein